MTAGNRDYRHIFPRKFILFIEKKILLLTVIFFLSISLSANPLLGNDNSNKTPSVRPPASGGFLVEKQLEFKNIIGDMLSNSKTDKDNTFVWSIIGFAFLYGVLHAAGPGHRKTVIFSMFLAKKAKWMEPLAAAFLSASVHGGTALVLILIFQFIFNKIISVQINNISLYMEGITYLLLLIFSLWFIIRIFLSFTGIKKKSPEIQTDRGLYATLLVSSFFPCPGVIMVMSFSVALGVVPLGVVAVVALSAGMGITISLVGYLAFLGREGIFKFFKQKEKTVSKISTILELFSFLFLFLFSLWMVFPFVMSISL